MTKLEKIFDDCKWERKFEGDIPREYNEVWREEEAAEAAKFLQGLPEEEEVDGEWRVRSLHLSHDSLGQVLIFDEEEVGPE